MIKNKLSYAVAVATLCVTSTASALTLEELAEKFEHLAAENERLHKRIEQLENSAQEVAKNSTPNKTLTGDLFEHDYSYAVLDPTTRINRKQEMILQKKGAGELGKNRVYASAAVTAVADYQKSNSESEFGYLMRHPTENNQRTKDVSEAGIHSAQFALTGNMGDWTTAYMEMLFDPQQSFGSGTNTDLNRNQVQVRQAYVLFGDLTQSPFYASLGKMATPFGLTDTPNPFTASTVWHAFGGLANGVKVGYLNDGLNISLMGIQGGAQFRAANAPVDDSVVPSKLNNYSVDANYTFNTTDDTSLLLGASYLKGSPYCQDFPVTHFSSCKKTNGAYDVYAQMHGLNWMVQAEFAKTKDVWPGTFNPALPEFGAEKVTSWGLGGKYRSKIGEYDVDYSADFSRFIAGPDGSPWEKQDQWVLGMAGFVTPSAKIFAELIRTEGYAPLNGVSSFDGAGPETVSNVDASSNIIIFGTNVAF